MHGLRRTYQSGCRCFPCKVAEARYRSDLRRLHRLGKQPLGATISAVETWRRIRQLKAEQFSEAEIARRIGLTRPELRLHPDRVRVKTMLLIRRLHRHMFGEGTA